MVHGGQKISPSHVVFSGKLPVNHIITLSENSNSNIFFRFVGYSVPAIMVAILLFIFPAYPFWKKVNKHKYNLEGWASLLWKTDFLTDLDKLYP